jgi:hypothetical protein
MTPPSERFVEEVDAQTLRHHFNIGQIEERAQRGQLLKSVQPGSEHLAPVAAGEPAGTLSHIVNYFDLTRQLVAIAHEYVRSDGSLGGSGRPDPKWMRVGDRILKLKRKKPKR